MIVLSANMVPPNAKISPECCRYADFLSRLNDERNIRALFERALSSLPPEESVEVFTLIFTTLYKHNRSLCHRLSSFFFLFLRLL